MTSVIFIRPRHILEICKWNKKRMGKKNAIKIKKIRWSLRWKSHCCRWTRKGIVEIGHVQPKHSTGEPTTEMLIYTHA